MDYTKLYQGMNSYADTIRQEAATKTEVVDEPRGLMQRIRKPKKETPPSPMTRVAKAFAQVKGFEGLPTEEVPAINAPTGGDPLTAAREALGKIESSNNYEAVGPVVEKGMYKGQRAYGKYQVMEGNIGPWTKKVLGTSMSVEEFVNSPAAQDAVVEYMLAQSYKKYGNWQDAASVWFSGGPISKTKNRDDGFTTVPEYVKRFTAAYNNLVDDTIVMASNGGEPLVRRKA